MNIKSDIVEIAFAEKAGERKAWPRITTRGALSVEGSERNDPSFFSLPDIFAWHLPKWMPFFVNIFLQIFEKPQGVGFNPLSGLLFHVLRGPKERGGLAIF